MVGRSRWPPPRPPPRPPLSGWAIPSTITIPGRPYFPEDNPVIEKLSDGELDVLDPPRTAQDRGNKMLLVVFPPRCARSAATAAARVPSLRLQLCPNQPVIRP